MISKEQKAFLQRIMYTKGTHWINNAEILQQKQLTHLILTNHPTAAANGHNSELSGHKPSH